MKLNRRQLLIGTGGLGLSTFGIQSLFDLSSNKDKRFHDPMGIIYGFGRDHFQQKKKYYLSIADLNHSDKPIKKIPMSFFGHGIAFHPYKKDIITVFEKKVQVLVKLILLLANKGHLNQW